MYAETSGLAPKIPTPRTPEAPPEAEAPAEHPVKQEIRIASLNGLLEARQSILARPDGGKDSSVLPGIERAIDRVSHDLGVYTLQHTATLVEQPAPEVAIK